MPLKPRSLLVVADSFTQRCFEATSQRQRCLFHFYHSDDLRSQGLRQQRPSGAPSQQTRPFSISTCLRKTARDRQPPQRQRAQQSTALAQKDAMEKAMKSSSIVHMAGILPTTFIMPTGNQVPSWQQSWRERLALESQRLAQLIINPIRNMYIARKMFEPRVPLDKAEDIARVARSHYEAIYTAYADGDVDRVARLVAPGYMEGLKRRIASRQKDTALEWNVIRYITPPKVVTHKVSPLPIGDKDIPKSETIGLAQAVVQLHSLQYLQTFKVKNKRDAAGKLISVKVPVDTNGDELDEGEAEKMLQSRKKERMEYLVLNKPIMQSKPGSWIAWGMTYETPWAKYKAEQKKYLDDMRMAKQMQKKKAI